MKLLPGKALSPALALSLMLAGAGLVHADPGLEKARTLFPAFSKAVYADESEADQLFNELVDLGPAVQQRLLTWLDEQFELKKSAYLSAKTGGTTGVRSASAGDTRKIKELQQQLSMIRNTSNEEEMKKTLKETGWPALKELLRIKGSTIQSMGDAKISEPDPEKARAALKEAKRVGEYRYKLREKLKQPVMDVESELKRGETDNNKGEEVASIAADGRAASVLAKNEKLKGQIPAQEYKGILEVNHWRIAAGMQPLLIDPKLCDAARDHCKDMESLGFFAHDSPVKGKTKPWDRAKNFGTEARGENIAINDSTEASNQAWFFSPGHHKNLFKPDFSVIGLGIKGRHYCQLFR